MGGKSSGENVLRNPFQKLAGKSAKYLACAHNFHWPDPWHKGG